ncbi:MAG: hypothetical protein JRC90_11600, partial [Deltaproteobacteria bacterium]|nr:hypothetical protein [Deltaproteobacteria bacterium]
MIRLQVAVASSATVYVPAPCRGNVSGAQAVWQDATVEADDTMILYRDSTAVNTITAVDTAGLQCETGMPNATIASRDLIFDPDSDTKANTVIKITNSVAGAALV